MDAELFVQNIKKYCQLKGVKPTVACRESGVGSSFINNVEARGSIPSVEKVQLLATYLGATTSELLGEVPTGDSTQARAAHPAPDSGLSDSEQTMLHSFRQLNDEGQKRSIEYLGDLLASGRYSSEGGSERLA